MKRLSFTALLSCLVFNTAHAQRRRDLDDDRKLAESKNWLYNNFDKAVARAEQSGKPILVYPNSGETWNAEMRRWVGTDRTIARTT